MPIQGVGTLWDGTRRHRAADSNSADSWSSHWDTGIQGSLGIRPRGTAGSQHSSSCLQGSCNGRTEASSGADTAQTWSHPAQAAQAKASTSCSSPIPPSCRITQGPIQTTSHKAGWIKHDGAKHVVGTSPVADSFWTWCGYHIFMQHQGAAAGHAMLHPTRSTNEEQCRVKTMACKTWKSRWVLWALHLRASDTTD